MLLRTAQPGAFLAANPVRPKSQRALPAAVPTIRLTSVTGYSEEQIAAFMAGATELAERTLGAQREGVIVHVEILPATHYMRGGKTIAERRRTATS